MPTNESTTPPLHDVWTGCYSSSWRDLIVPEAYSHPAKFSRNLIQKIYQHCAEESWLKPGDTVLDCFSGTGLGGLDAALAGYRFVGVELELRFHALAHGFDCGGGAAKHEACSQQGTHDAHHVTGNLELWARRYSHLPQYVAPTLLQGDSRRLGALLREQVNACVASPPFQTTLQIDNPERMFALLQALHRDGKGHGSRKLPPSMAQSYGTHPAQLGNLPAGQVECAISSPPYEASVTVGHAPEKNIERALAAGHTLASMRNPGGQLRYGFEYGTDPAQLGNEHGTTFWDASKQIVQQVFDLLKPNGVAIFVVKDYVREGAIVPFSQQWRTLAEHCGFVTVHIHHALLVEDHGTQGGLFGVDTQHRTERKSFFRRLHERKRPDLAIDHETVLCLRKPADSVGGEVAACCASPPWTATLGGGNGTVERHDGFTDRPQTHANHHGGRAGQSMLASYGQTEGQLGAMAPGSFDLCLSSPPYAEALAGAPNMQASDRQHAAARGRNPETAGSGYPRHYGQTEGQLGAMCAGQPPHPEEVTP